MDNWSAFIRTLRVQFGPIDPTADAEDGIDNLKTHDNQHIVKYNVEFNRLAIRTGWDDGVLRHHHYSGLAECIKDIMGQQGKPTTLDEMKFLAHSIDSHHWERLHEKSQAGRSKSDSHDKSDSKNNKSDDKGKTPASSSNQSNQSKNKNKSNNNKPAKPASSSGTSASITDKLGKDSKLTQEERQCRFDNNLCLFCGGTGHTAKNCPKSTSSASKTKARAAQVKEKETLDPLTRLTRKGVPWNFSDAARKSFEALKSAFTSAPILTHWLPDKQMITETDTSEYALGAILSLQTDSGEIHPVAFHSCTFTPSD
jgi:hypothetical protein